MACSSLVALPRACGSQGVVGGLEKLYVLAAQDLGTVSGSTEAYTVATGGLINQIALKASKKFVEVGLLKSTSGVDQKLNKDNSKGTNYMTNTLKLVLSDLTPENAAFIESVRYQPVVTLIKTRTGRYFAVGLNSQFELSAIEGGTGTAEADLVGSTLTFEGVDPAQIRQVDGTIIASLIA